MQAALTIIHVIIGLLLIGLVLIQRGKGAEAGAAFGAGSSGGVFGARGATTFLGKATRYLIITFFVTSLLLARSYAQKDQGGESKVPETNTSAPPLAVPNQVAPSDADGAADDAGFTVTVPGGAAEGVKASDGEAPEPKAEPKPGDASSSEAPAAPADSASQPETPAPAAPADAKPAEKPAPEAAGEGQ